MLTLNDGRAELWQWDTGRTLAVDADCSQVHFSNKVFGRSIDVDVTDGVAVIPDVLLQTDNDLNVWAFAGTADNGYTKISKTFKVNRRNKPSDYVFTPVEQTTIAEIAAIAQSVRDDADAGRFDGAQGPAGPAGPVGPKGDTGEQGPAGTGVPDGGASGQLLSKTESGTEWIDPPQSAVQPDWNQNDDTQPDYVKNRPFYTSDPVETVLVEESTVSFAAEDGMYTGQLESTFSATVGETYKVSWDGTTYECACIDFNGNIVIGNLSIVGAGSDTGEPFVMSVLNGQAIGISTADTASSHTFSISGMAAQVVKIDEKYLPKLPFMDKVNPTGTGAFSLNRKADTTIGNYSFAECHNTTASGQASHAEGTSTTASGYSSHAEGTSTTASGYSSHAEGTSTTASDQSSHAEGTDTIASGSASHAEGMGTKASSHYQHVHGKYNIEDTSNTYAEIVGNGTQLERSNAYTLDWSGNAWYAGTVEGKALILPSSTTDSTKKFKITVDDSGTISATEVT